MIDRPTDQRGESLGIQSASVVDAAGDDRQPDAAASGAGARAWRPSVGETATVNRFDTWGVTSDRHGDHWRRVDPSRSGTWRTTKKPGGERERAADDRSSSAKVEGGWVIQRELQASSSSVCSLRPRRHEHLPTPRTLRKEAPPATPEWPSPSNHRSLVIPRGSSKSKSLARPSVRAAEEAKTRRNQQAAIHAGCSRFNHRLQSRPPARPCRQTGRSQPSAGPAPGPPRSSARDWRSRNDSASRGCDAQETASRIARAWPAPGIPLVHPSLPSAGCASSRGGGPHGASHDSSDAPATGGGPCRACARCGRSPTAGASHAPHGGPPRYCGACSSRASEAAKEEATRPADRSTAAAASQTPGAPVAEADAETPTVGRGCRRDPWGAGTSETAVATDGAPVEQSLPGETAAGSDAAAAGCCPCPGLSSGHRGVGGDRTAEEAC